MGPYLGDFRGNQTIDFKWDTNDGSGASITRATDGTVSVYKANGTTQTTTGVTDTEDFDSLTGIHHLRVATTDAFYATGNDYQVVLSAATIDGQTVNSVLCTFSIENRQANVTQIDGEDTDGNNATLNLKKLNIVNSAGDAIVASATGSNGDGLAVSGNGSGHAVHAVGGATGASLLISSVGTDAISVDPGSYSSLDLNGGASSPVVKLTQAATGPGVLVDVAAGNGIHIDTDNGVGILVDSDGALGHGIHVVSRATGHAVYLEKVGAAAAAGLAVKSNGGTAMSVHSAAYGIQALLVQCDSPGSATGHAIRLVASNSGSGLHSTGSGSGNAYYGKGGATGIGMNLQGGGTSGHGLSCIATNGYGVSMSAQGAGNPGLSVTSSGASTPGFYIRGSGGGLGIDVPEIGTPLSLGEGASLSSMLFAMANATNGVNGYDQTTDSLEAIQAAIAAGGGLTAQQVRDAMKLAPTVGAPAAGSVDTHLDDIDAKTTNLPAAPASEGNVDDVQADVTAIKAKTDNLPADPASESNVSAVGAAVVAVGVDVSSIETKVGTPVALDGGAATLSGMLAKMADDNGGADYDAESDSLHTMSTYAVAEPGVGVPAATDGLRGMVAELYSAHRNKGIMSKTGATTAIKTFYNSAGAARVEKNATDDGTDYTENAMVAV